MNIVYSLTCFLLAGILGSSNARDEMESLCAKNGGPRAYQNLQIGIVDLQSCFKSVADEGSLEAERSGGEMDAAFAVYCNRVGTLKQCAKRFLISVKTCLEPGQHEVADIVYNMSTSLLDFSCENSKLFEAAMKSQDQQCLIYQLDAMETCANKITASSNITIFNRSETLSDPIGTLSNVKLKFEGKECREIQDAEECTVKVLAECKDQTFTKILDSLWKRINDNIPCDNLTKSAASTAGLVNIVLLFVAVITMTF